MKKAIEMDSGAKFHKDWFRHSNIDGGDRHTGRRSHRPILGEATTE
jgi:hypothetical protein